MKTASVMLLVLLTFVSANGQGAEAESNSGRSDFKSDGCSLWPDGNYRDCCVEHDKAYFVGGGFSERREADKILYRCVKSKGRGYNKLIAPMMWFGVRLGGVGFLPTPFRWGFGNKFPAVRPKTPGQSRGKQ